MSTAGRHRNEIEHFLVLHNDTDTPWTTGPCLASSDEMALSEDLLKYVPKGGKGEMPVTTAINIAHDQKESEADRKLKAISPQRLLHGLVTLDGELTLRKLRQDADRNWSSTCAFRANADGLGAGGSCWTRESEAGGADRKPSTGVLS